MLHVTRHQPAHKEQHNAHSDVSEHHAHPDLHAEGIHEGEDPGSLLYRLLDHDGDSERHERFGEVGNLLPLRVDSERSDGYLRLSPD